MELLPAIDVYGGKVVRLTRGAYDQMTVYRDDPVAQALDFEQAGARWLHTVDLEGARTGETPNLAVIQAICRRTGLRVEVGGGIRSLDTIARYLDGGVERVILGTRAVTDPDFLAQATRKFGAAVAVGLDLKEGAIAIHGWEEQSPLGVEEFLQTLVELGVQTVICTDVSRDGMLGGSNVALYRTLNGQFPLQFVASGGVSTLGELAQLKELGLYGAILGKALYTGALDLAQALREVE